MSVQTFSYQPVLNRIARGLLRVPLVSRVVGRWLKGVFPVSTGIVVTAFARTEYLVEVDATAVIPD